MLLITVVVLSFPAGAELARPGYWHAAMLTDDGQGIQLLQVSAEVHPTKDADNQPLQSSQRKELPIISTRHVLTVVGSSGVAGVVAAENVQLVQSAGPPHSRAHKFRKQEGPTAADVMLLKRNTEGDLQAFLDSLTIYSAVTISLLAVFCLLRIEFPLVLAGNVARSATCGQETASKTDQPSQESATLSPEAAEANARRRASSAESEEPMMSTGTDEAGWKTTSADDQPQARKAAGAKWNKGRPPAPRSQQVPRAPFPRRPDGGLFTWIGASLGTTVDEVERNIGLDAAMLLEFSNLASRICAVIGVPMCLVMCPLHYWFGGQPMQVDHLSRLGMANIARGSWLYWLHAVVVWMVMLTVESMIHEAQERFLERRFRWLKSMPPPRSTTVLVECIPSRFCSDVELRKFFSSMFSPDKIVAVHVIRRTERLLRLIGRVRDAEQLLRQAHYAWARTGQRQDQRPMHHIFGVGDVDSIEHFSNQMDRNMHKIREERRHVGDPKATDPALFATSAFVTFSSRREAEIALRLQYQPDAEQFVMSIPPEPSDIRWADLRADPTRQVVKERLGYLCAIGLYLGFVPITVSVSSVTNLDHLRNNIGIVDQFMDSMPRIASYLEGVFASLALTLFMSFLPTFLMQIFSNFFILKAEAWAQHKLQVWYFWFMVVFILLVTAVGGSLIIAVESIAERPLEVFGLLADSMPAATNFYLNYMVLQWVTHSMNLTRYITLIKFLIYRTVCDAKRAKALCEPEDQDYYGFGARSAQWTICLVIALVFCQLSPLISLLTLVNFLLCRLIYGYLIVYAEQPKPDLGGVFFVQQLVHLQKGILIYLALMIGVLYRGSEGLTGPVVLAGAAPFYLLTMYRRFERGMQWENLPFAEIVLDGDFKKRRTTRDSYEQPEFRDPPDEGPPHEPSQSNVLSV